LKLCAGRTGQEINLTALGSDAGVSRNTARAWLSVLETGYIIHRLPAWRADIRKQIVKAPKLHFFDSGLVCYLLGIREPGQLRLHPLRGAIFESAVISEIYKVSIHRGVQPSMFHYRESRGLEIDLLIAQGEKLSSVEIKSGARATADFFKNLKRFSDRMKSCGKTHPIHSYVVYGGDVAHQRSDVQVLSWRHAHRANSE
jgi:predicted AAA+ superfamily ATPase